MPAAALGCAGWPMIQAGIAEFYALHESAEKAQAISGLNHMILNAQSFRDKSMAQSLILSGDLPACNRSTTRAIAEGHARPWTEEVCWTNVPPSAGAAQAVLFSGGWLCIVPDIFLTIFFKGTAYRSCGNLMESVRVLGNSKKLRAREHRCSY